MRGRFVIALLATMVFAGFVEAFPTRPMGSNTFTSPILFADGAVGAPGIGFASQPGMGFSRGSADYLYAYNKASGQWWEISPAGFRVSSDVVMPGTLYAPGGAAPTIGSLNGTGIFQNAVAGNQGTTVGAAGGASALPGAPLGYMRMKLADGTEVVFPYWTKP